MIDARLLEIVCCPETRQPLSAAEPSLLQQLNEQIQAGRVLNRGGRPVTRPCDGGLIRRDGHYLYPICQDIPILLVNESIPLEPPSPRAESSQAR